ncbi:MAG: YidB family protein [Syntrophobacteraceae bacterium]|nr:YidB family protein [Syntrophobacteraceae bacterium]
MSFIEDMVQKVLGLIKGSQDEQAGLAQGVMGLLTSRETGGLEGLIQAFEQRGLGEVISSWVGNGENMAITPQQVHEVLGSNVIQQLAEKANLSPDETKLKLSELLPTLIDKITSEGNIPKGGWLDKGKELLGRR